MNLNQSALNSIYIVQREFMEYRTGLVKELRKTTKVIVLCSKNQSSLVEDVFEVELITFYGLYWFKNLEKFLPENIFLIIEGNFRILNLYRFFWQKRKLVLWGPWLSKNILVQKIQRTFLVSDNIVPMFYYKTHQDGFKKIGITNSSSFVAINTIAIESRQGLIEDRSADLCFIGSLNKRKKLDVVLNILSTIEAKGIDFVFHIVGDGPELSNLKELVSALRLNDRVLFHGRITETDYLNKIVSHSRLSISYGQAGLSVLHSFALGTPFITMSNAISGGEISCIQHGVNGYICQSKDEFEYWITHCLTELDITMARNAVEYYWSFASPEIWCANVINGLSNNFENKYIN